MINRNRCVFAISLALAALMASGCASGSGESRAAAEPVMDVRAEEHLRRMTDYLAKLERFRFEVDVAYDDYLVEDELIQKSRRVTIEASRPSRVRGASVGDGENNRYWFDGRQMTVFDAINNVYAVLDCPGTIDTLLDTLAERYDVVVPLAELVASDAHRWLMGNVTDATYVGESTVNGVRCHHLSYRQPTLNWQIWIDAGAEPLPRKLAIRYKQLIGNPQYTATFVKWDASLALSDADFSASIPAEAQRVEYQPPKAGVGSGTRPE